MPEYKTPGVYVEIQEGTPPIQPVGTSTAAFIGVVPGNVPMPLTPDGAPFEITPALVTQLNAAVPPVPASATSKLSTIMSPTNPHVFNSAADFKSALKTALGDADYGQYGQQITDAAWTRYTVASPSKLVPLTSFDQFVTSFGDVQPWNPNTGNSVLAHAVFGFFLNGGARCYVARVTDWTAAQTDAAMDLMTRVDDISIVAAPGAPVDNQNMLIDHCALMKYRFAIVDGQKLNLPTPPISLGTVEGTNAKKSKFAAMYFPYLKVNNLANVPADPDTVDIPPSGHVAGVYARTDIQQGVHYSPANTDVRGALNVRHRIDDADQGDLNVVTSNNGPVNVIRNFKGNITVWGARTRAAVGSDDAEFNYVSVQRTMSMIAQSIDEGTRFAVFKPNNKRLWEQIKRSVNGFLATIWRDGALFGATPEQAFYVKCDEGTNPPESRALGRVIIEIGVAIVTPAEFVIFRISQQTQITP